MERRLDGAQLPEVIINEMGNAQLINDQFFLDRLDQDIRVLSLK